MKARLLSLLVCPGCKGNLVLDRHAEVGKEITEGTLSCTMCGSMYPAAPINAKLVIGLFPLVAD